MLTFVRVTEFTGKMPNGQDLPQTTEVVNSHKWMMLLLCFTGTEGKTSKRRAEAKIPTDYGLPFYQFSHWRGKNLSDLQPTC